MTFIEALMIFALWAQAKGHKAQFWIALAWAALSLVVQIGKRAV